MIATTATVALIGMVVVFAFLGILVVCISAMGVIFRKANAAEAAEAAAKAAAKVRLDPRLIAAVTAAYHNAHQPLSTK